MAEFYRFFDNEIGDEREYTSLEMCELLYMLKRNGVIVATDALAAGLLQVTAPGTGFTVEVAPGEGFVLGHFYKNTTTKTLTIDAESSGVSRKDYVILRMSNVTRTLTAEVLKGVASVSPVLPTLTQNTTTFELPLASINITGGASSLTNANIIDLRIYTSPKDSVQKNASSINNAIVSWDGTDGQKVKNAGFLISDTPAFKGYIPAAANLNDYTETGIYGYLNTGSLTNAPEGGAFMAYGALHVINSGGFIMQNFISWELGLAYNRFRQNTGEWFGWQTMESRSGGNVEHRNIVNGGAHTWGVKSSGGGTPYGMTFYAIDGSNSALIPDGPVNNYLGTSLNAWLESWIHKVYLDDISIAGDIMPRTTVAFPDLGNGAYRMGVLYGTEVNVTGDIQGDDLAVSSIHQADSGMINFIEGRTDFTNDINITGAGHDIGTDMVSFPNIGTNLNRFGTIYCVTLNQSSDPNKKRDIKEYSQREAWEALDKAKVYKYKWKHEENGAEHLGLLANEVPEIVGPDGMSIETYALSSWQFAALKEAKAEIEALKDELAELKEQVKEIKNLMGV